MTNPLPVDDVVAIIGSRPKLAKVCGVDASTPYSWRHVPAEHVPAVARATGLAPHIIRPDLPQLFPAQHGGPRAKGAA